MIDEIIKKLVDKKNLLPSEMESAMEELMQGRASLVQIAAFLVGFRLKGETADEITAGAKIMRRYATKLDLAGAETLDTCGTGGDNARTFNISTISAIVAAGAGVKVAKHGNKAVSSRCGSADLLKALGVNIDVDKAITEKCIKELGFGFLFAPYFHSAMKYVAPVRKELGIRTIFNILGPLANPSESTYQLLGVFDVTLVLVLAEVLKNLGTKHAMVVCGDDGLDELTTTTQTQIGELKDNKIITYKLNPEELGFKRAGTNDLAGGDSIFNAKIAMDILNGKSGPATDAVLLNAGCAIYTANAANTIKEGIQKAKDSISSKSALRVLNKLIEYTNAAV